MTQEQRNVDGIEVFIEGQGDETVVMIHGWPDTHRLWDAQVEHLRDRYRCVRFTLPGFDVERAARAVPLAEMVALFKSIVDSVSPERPVTLLLHDWGAIFGYQFAVAHPQRVARIVGVDIGDTNSGEFLRSLTGKAKLGIAIYQLWLAAAWLIGGSLGTRMTRAMARSLRCRTDPAHIGWQMDYPYWLQWSGGYRASQRFMPHCPMLYIHGTRKPFQFQSPQWLEKVAALPRSEVLGLNTGHWVMVEQPAQFNEAVARWLDAA